MSTFVTIRVSLLLLALALLAQTIRARLGGTVVIEAEWERASTADVEQRVTQVLFRALSRLPGVQRVESETSPELARLEVRVGRKWARFEALLLAELDRVRGELPAGVVAHLRRRPTLVTVEVTPIDDVLPEQLEVIATRLTLALEKDPLVQEVRTLRPAVRRELIVIPPLTSNDDRTTSEILAAVRSDGVFTFPAHELESAPFADRIIARDERDDRSKRVLVIARMARCAGSCEQEVWRLMAGEIPTASSVAIESETESSEPASVSVRTIDRRRIRAAGVRESDVLDVLSAIDGGLALGKTAERFPVIARVEALETATVQSRNGSVRMESLLGPIEARATSAAQRTETSVHVPMNPVALSLALALTCFAFGPLERSVRRLRAVA